MLRKQWFMILAGLTFLLTACSAVIDSVELPGLQALSDSAGVTDSTAAAPDELSRLADQAEADQPLLDVVQVTRDDNYIVLVYAVLGAISRDGLSEDEVTNAQIDLVRTTAEAVWAAGLQYTPDASSIGIVFMEIRPVNTLDHGPAPTAWQVLGIMAVTDSAAAYLAGPHNQDAFLTFSTSEDVIIATLDRAYLGRPNHPLRSLEA